MIQAVMKLFILVGILAGCASTQPVPPLNLGVAPAPVAAQYETHRQVSHKDGHGHAEHGSTTVQWQFFRDESRILIHNLSAHTGESWVRDGQSIIMRQLFHDDRKAVEYRMDDFAVLGMTPSWDKQALLVDPAVLKRLEFTGSDWQDGHPVRRYQGVIDGHAFDVVWITDLNLPLSMTLRHGEEVETTRLQSVRELSQIIWPTDDGADYVVIDYADLGDMERDPFVQKIQSQLPGGHVHHH